jgi:hypothetical protein
MARADNAINQRFLIVSVRAGNADSLDCDAAVL